MRDYIEQTIRELESHIQRLNSEKVNLEHDLTNKIRDLEERLDQFDLSSIEKARAVTAKLRTFVEEVASSRTKFAKSARDLLDTL